MAELPIMLDEENNLDAHKGYGDNTDVCWPQLDNLTFNEVKKFDISNAVQYKVAGVLYKTDPDGSPSYLLLKRTKEDGGFRQYMTGTLDESESFLDCLKRELNEETGMTSSDILSISPMFYSFFRTKKDGRTIYDFTYSIQVSSDVTPIIAPLEHDEYRWESFETAIELLYTEENRIALRKSYEMQKNK